MLHYFCIALAQLGDYPRASLGTGSLAIRLEQLSVVRKAKRPLPKAP